jgi:PAS domain S-box-containing protein
MNVFETLQQAAQRLQIPQVIGSFPADGSGHIEILYANAPAVSLFGYTSSEAMVGMDVRALMPDEHAKDHKDRVRSYISRANGGSRLTGGIMETWRDLQAKKRDGSLVPVRVNVADIPNSEERYFVAIFLDRTLDVQREAENAQARQEAEEARKAAEAAAEEMRILKEEAQQAQRIAEDNALKQRRLSGQITLLRQIFAGTVGLVVMLGVLVVAQWSTGSEGDGLSMIKDVLLVMTGILGSAMASVFDTRNRDST